MRKISTVAILCLAASTWAIPATAASKLATHLTELSVAPAEVRPESPDRTFSGQLTFTATDGTEHALGGAPVHVEADAGLGKAVVAVDLVTDTDGRFAGNVRNAAARRITATYRGDTTYAKASAGRGGLTPIPASARISVDVSPRPQTVGQAVTATGLAEYQTADGRWLPLADQPVRIWFRPFNDNDPYTDLIVRTRTAADGTYKTSVPVPGSYYWTADVACSHTAEEQPYKCASVGTDYYEARYPSRITALSVKAEPDRQLGETHVTGRIEAWTVDGWVPWYGGVQLSFRKAGSATFKRIAAFYPETKGALDTTAALYGPGTWRVETNDSTLLPSSATHAGDPRQVSFFTSFNASPEPVRKGRTITVQGTLKRHPSSWQAYAKQTVKLYFQPKGSKKWAYEGKATTDKKGHFTHGFKAAKDGTWRAVFAGNSSYLSTTGPGDYVDVR